MSINNTNRGNQMGQPEQWLSREVDAINQTMSAHKIVAGTNPAWAMVARSSHVSYRIGLGKGQAVGKIEAIGRELNEAISNARGKPTQVRFAFTPFSIEVPHPQIQPLKLSRDDLAIAPHSMLAGRSYSHYREPRAEVVSFDDTPHVLAVGVTGAGKSVLQSMMLLSLCLNTSPKDLKLVLVDLKNEDLIPFKRLPHVLSFSGRIEDAVKAIDMVVNEVEARVDDLDRRPHRMLLAIDELAEFATDKDSRTKLGRIGGLGRSKSINLLAATQHPTKEGGMGSMMRANFPLRLVGMVTPGLSHIATGRAKAGADMLPGKGSFLWSEAADIRRFQSYYVDSGDIEMVIDSICRKWGGSRPVAELVMTGYSTGYDSVATGCDNQSQPVITGYQSENASILPEKHQNQGGDAPVVDFPIRIGRPLTENEKRAVRQMANKEEYQWRGQLSMNRLVKAVYKSKDDDRIAWVQDALGDIAPGKTTIKLSERKRAS